MWTRIHIARLQRVRSLCQLSLVHCQDQRPHTHTRKSGDSGAQPSGPRNACKSCPPPPPPRRAAILILSSPIIFISGAVCRVRRNGRSFFSASLIRSGDVRAAWRLLPLHQPPRKRAPRRRANFLCNNCGVLSSRQIDRS